jgi:hyperosmotically inducible protein
MKRHLASVLCALSFAACATNRPADAPLEASPSDSTPPPVASADATPIVDPALDPVNAAPASAGTRAATPATGTSTPGAADYKTMDASVAPDNTKMNKRDVKGSAPTPLDQGEGQADLDITQKIRKAVMGDGSLSFNAKNVKIITQNGKVTLRGPVSSNAERSSIQAAAQKVAGAGNVDNQIEVKK